VATLYRKLWEETLAGDPQAPPVARALFGVYLEQAKLGRSLRLSDHFRVLLEQALVATDPVVRTLVVRALIEVLDHSEGRELTGDLLGCGESRLALRATAPLVTDPSLAREGGVVLQGVLAEAAIRTAQRCGPEDDLVALVRRLFAAMRARGDAFHYGGALEAFDPPETWTTTQPRAHERLVALRSAMEEGEP